MSDPWKADLPIREDNIINESERSVDPTDDEYKLVKLEADGKIARDFLNIPNQQVVKFTTSGTWTKPTGLKYVVVEVVGGGGGSGGATNAGGIGGGGGGGGYSKKLINASSLGSTETVTVGSGGEAGGSTISDTATDGETSSFGSHLSANGGGRGNFGSGGQGAAGDGGSSTGGDLNMAGGDGFQLRGGASLLSTARSNNDSTPGKPGNLYGGGASGAIRGGSGSHSGAAGAPGIVIVTEYY